MATAIVSNTKFNTKHIAAGIDEGFLDATSLAEYLVSKGVPFRQAHGIVGGLVAQCEKENVKLFELGIEVFKSACDKIEEDVYDSLGAANVAKAYKSSGAGGTDQVLEQIEFWKETLKGR